MFYLNTSYLISMIDFFEKQNEYTGFFNIFLQKNHYHKLKTMYIFN